MLQLNLIVAICEKSGIGFKGGLPWRLKSELKYFGTTTRRTTDINKRNAVIMGRRTYYGVPPGNRPLRDRLNIVLSTTLQQGDLPEDVLLYPSLEAALKKLQETELRNQIETVWIVGGSGVYKEAMQSPFCHRLYITEIKKPYECDTFFPEIPHDFVEVELDEFIPQGLQEEDGVQFEYKVLEKCHS